MWWVGWVLGLKSGSAKPITPGRVTNTAPPSRGSRPGAGLAGVIEVMKRCSSAALGIDGCAIRAPGQGLQAEAQTVAGDQAAHRRRRGCAVVPIQGARAVGQAHVPHHAGDPEATKSVRSSIVEPPARAR